MSLRIDNADDLQTAKSTLFGNNRESCWILLNYVSSSVVHFAASGNGVVELYDYRKDDEIQYGLVRLANIQDPDTQTTINRDVFIVIIGPGVSMIQKSKQSGYLADAQAMLQPFAATVTVENFDRLSEDTLIACSAPSATSRVI